MHTGCMFRERERVEWISEREYKPSSCAYTLHSTHTHTPNGAFKVLKKTQFGAQFGLVGHNSSIQLFFVVIVSYWTWIELNWIELNYRKPVSTPTGQSIKMSDLNRTEPSPCSKFKKKREKSNKFFDYFLLSLNRYTPYTDLYTVHQYVPVMIIN